MDISTHTSGSAFQTKLSFRNDENLEVELNHTGNFFNIQELSVLSFILHNVPSNERGFNAFRNAWHLHQQYDYQRGISQEFFGFHDQVTQLREDLQSLRVPEEFDRYYKLILTKLDWIQQFYLKIATLENISIGRTLFKAKKLATMKKRRLEKTVNKLIALAEKEGIIASDETLCRKSEILTNTFHISFCVLPRS